MMRLLRPREVEEILGLSRNSIRRLVAQGELTPIFVTPRRPRYDATEVAAFVERRKEASV